jgi:hypothetical protein
LRGSVSAPASHSSRTTSTWPSSAAWRSGVQPSGHQMSTSPLPARRCARTCARGGRAASGAGRGGRAPRALAELLGQRVLPASAPLGARTWSTSPSMAHFLSWNRRASSSGLASQCSLSSPSYGALRRKRMSRWSRGRAAKHLQKDLSPGYGSLPNGALPGPHRAMASGWDAGLDVWIPLLDLVVVKVHVLFGVIPNLAVLVLLHPGFQL